MRSCGVLNSNLTSIKIAYCVTCVCVRAGGASPAKQVNVYSAAAVARACESVLARASSKREFDATCGDQQSWCWCRAPVRVKRKVDVRFRTERGVIIFPPAGGKTPDEYLFFLFGGEKFSELRGKELAEVRIIVGRRRTE